MDNTVNKLIGEIRNIALSGQQDGVFGQEFILWQNIGTFLAVYAEDMGVYGQYTYLLYKCSDGAEYNRSIIMDPLLETENFRCLFEYKEYHGQQELIRFVDEEQWIDEFEELVKDMVSEN